MNTSELSDLMSQRAARVAIPERIISPTPTQNSTSSNSPSMSGSLIPSWDPRAPAREADEVRELRDAEKQEEPPVRAGKPASTNVIEISDDEDDDDKKVSLISSTRRRRESSIQVLTEPAKQRSPSRSESPSLFLPQDDPQVWAFLQQGPMSASPPAFSNARKPTKVVQKVPSITDLITPSPPRRALHIAESTTFIPSKRKRAIEIDIEDEDDDLPPRKSIQNRKPGSGYNSEAHRRVDVGRGSGNKDSPRERFKAAMVDSKAENELIEKIMKLYDETH